MGRFYVFQQGKRRILKVKSELSAASWQVWSWCQGAWPPAQWPLEALLGWGVVCIVSPRDRPTVCPEPNILLQRSMKSPWFFRRGLCCSTACCLVTVLFLPGLPEVGNQQQNESLGCGRGVVGQGVVHLCSSPRRRGPPRPPHERHRLCPACCMLLGCAALI